MKRFAAMAAGLAMVFAFAGQASAQSIVGSAHDFSSELWAVNGEVCNVCHTPHNASVLTAAPLWNHTLTSTDFTGNLYGGYDMQSSPTNPVGSSLLCLSCHDGTIALDDFGGGAGTGPLMGAVNPSADLGTSLVDDHPIGIVYADAEVDTEIRAATADPNWTGSGITAISEVLDPAGGTLECASCHDVHNNGASGAGFFLRAANTGSSLCLGCHIK